MVYELKYRGIYVDFWVGVRLCRRYGLAELEKELRTWKGVPQEPELSEPEVPEPLRFFEITDLTSPVMVRMSDFRINASHIVKLSGRPTSASGGLKKRWDSKAYEIVRGNVKFYGAKCQGTYVDFDIGIELCQIYGLSELRKRLYSLRSTSEGLVSEAEPSHVGPRSQMSGRLPETLGSGRVSVQNESTQSRGI